MFIDSSFDGSSDPLLRFPKLLLQRLDLLLLTEDDRVFVLGAIAVELRRSLLLPHLLLDVVHDDLLTSWMA